MFSTNQSASAIYAKLSTFSCGECDVDRLGSLEFYFLIFKSVLDCSSCEAMAGSLFVATTAVLPAKVAVIYSGEVGRSAVYSRYNNGPRHYLGVRPH
jgi:hypothetical protein